MKILAYVLGGLLVLILCVVGFIFSSYGNSLLASYAQNFAQQKAGIRLEFQKFNLNFSSIYAQATINGEISAEICLSLKFSDVKFYSLPFKFEVLKFALTCRKSNLSSIFYFFTHHQHHADPYAKR